MTTILLAGASGFIGAALERSLVADGHHVERLSRGNTGGVRWNPARGEVDAAALATLAPDIVINLAGEPIAQRWSEERKRAIYESRINGTRALAAASAALPVKPRVFVGGSAIGYYGFERGDEPLTERSTSGADFLAKTARDWEIAATPASDAGIRVVALRTGIVCGRDGGVLARLLPPFQAGVGGPLGDGQQWMSWISLTDTVRAIRFLIDTAGARGPFNLVAPEPVRNAEFAGTLGSVLHRPALVPTPRFALQLLFGEMAKQTILASQRAVPEKLTGAGFEFRHPRLKEALAFELRR
ncbi:MAG TPA: TIGR01777 family oxidoreductase [Gemmatimonadaceae bacterium]|nr:TIGR01777 family oxidoreductase [Gemmatimonadaceae bacterium]